MQEHCQFQLQDEILVKPVAITSIFDANKDRTRFVSYSNCLRLILLVSNCFPKPM